MYPDLIARTCGYLGVFIALIVMGIWGEPEFAVTPQQSFDRIALSLHVLGPEAPTPDQVQEPAEPEETPEPQAEPVPEPEPTPQPEEIPAPEPIPAPEAVTEPEITPPPTQVHTTPVQTEKQAQAPQEPKAQPKEESKPKAQEKPVEKKQDKPKAQAKPQQPRSTATTTQNKAKPQAAAAKEAPTAKAPATTDASANLDRQLRSQLSSLLVREIRSHLKYPRNAVRRKLEGTVMMEFEVKNGVVVDFVLRQSSGHKILDEAARKLAQKLVQFNTRLGAMNYRVQIPIKYELL